MSSRLREVVQNLCVGIDQSLNLIFDVYKGEGELFVEIASSEGPYLSLEDEDMESDLKDELLRLFFNPQSALFIEKDGGVRLTIDIENLRVVSELKTEEIFEAEKIETIESIRLNARTLELLSPDVATFEDESRELLESIKEQFSQRAGFVSYTFGFGAEGGFFQTSNVYLTHEQESLVSSILEEGYALANSSQCSRLPSQKILSISHKEISKMDFEQGVDSQQWAVDFPFAVCEVFYEMTDEYHPEKTMALSEFLGLYEGGYFQKNPYLQTSDSALASDLAKPDEAKKHIEKVFGVKI